MLRHIAYLASMAVLLLYIANPTAGVFELIPDNLPVVGNLDEAAVTALLLSLFRRWRNPEPVPGPRQPDANRWRDRPSRNALSERLPRQRGQK